MYCSKAGFLTQFYTLLLPHIGPLKAFLRNGCRATAGYWKFFISRQIILQQQVLFRILPDSLSSEHEKVNNLKSGTNIIKIINGLILL
jgi:hypothetical protein